MQRFVKPIIVLIAVLATVLLVLAMNSQKHDVAPTPTVSVSPVANPPTKEELLRLVNAERAKNGVAPLAIDEQLEKSAQWKVDDEVTYKYFGHVKPGTTGNNGLDYLNSIGNQCVHVGENLVHNVDRNTGQDLNNTSSGSVDAWIKSPLHHAAMINPKYSLTGFGINGTEISEHFCQVK